MLRISVFVYLLFSTFSIIVFYLPLYLKEQGLDASQVGAVLACGSVVAMIAQIFWGYVSDVRKTVRGVLLVVLAGSILLGFGLFTAEAYASLLLFYAGFMFFNSASAPMTETLCVSYAAEHRKDYGRLRVWGEVGIGTSALLFNAVIAATGLDALWLLYGLATLLALGSVLLVRGISAAPAAVDLASIVRLFRQPRLLWFFLLMLIVAIPHRMNDSMLSLYLEELGAEDKLGLAWLIATLSTIPAMMFAGKLIGRIGELGLFALAGSVYAVRWAAYGAADDPNVLVALQAMHSLTFPLFLVASIRYLTVIIPPELRASGQAGFAVVFGGLGSMIGTAGGGAVIDAFGPQAAYTAGSGFALAGALAAAGTIFYYRYQSRIRKPLAK